jgi:Fe/S biogenesis protein NfuA
MIEVSSTARRYFSHLIEQQDEPDLGLRIRVIDPGTPRASCDLQFCPEGQQQDTDLGIEFEEFNLYVSSDSSDWLSEAEIDFEEDAGGGQLSIRAPNIKGSMPGEDAGLAERVAWVLETEINPGLASHGGMVALEEITAAHEIVLRFGGGCHGCGMVDVTLKEGIEKTLKGHFPEIRGIRDATDHSTGENPYYD